MVDSIVRFDIRADNTVLYESLDSCGEHVTEEVYAWQASSDDKITITTTSGGWIDNTYKIDVTPSQDCRRLTFSYYTPDFPLYDFTAVRAQLCLFMSEDQCMADWCGAEPNECDQG